MLTPPKLPRFLADLVNLRVIEGVPTDSEVKLVHAAIRSLNEVVHVPGLYDPDLTVGLSEYLFGVQMGIWKLIKSNPRNTKERYREKYPCIIFPSSTTYTPPQLPPHIRVSLEPVKNTPSDDQIKSVQTALRISENLANVPSMFDADLSMNLSQHLFDIQFGRYLWKTANREHDRQVTSSIVSANRDREPQDIAHAGEIVMDDLQNPGHHDRMVSPQVPLVDSLLKTSSLETKIISLQSDLSALRASMSNIPKVDLREGIPLSSQSFPESTSANNEPTPGSESPIRQPQSPTPSPEFPVMNTEFSLPNPEHTEDTPEPERMHNTQADGGTGPIEISNAGTERTNRLLVQICDKLDDMKRFMVATQHSMAMGLNATRYSDIYAYHHGLVGVQGRILSPWSYYQEAQFRSTLTGNQERVDDSHLVQFLLRYGIENGLVTDGTNPSLITDQKDQAIAAARQYLGI
ncbi:hypothetical protein RhiJN_10973 [Ceratobasidium sp. AG-Ba]|nr:hypothetical protein RhiJN_10973 [Ceratobasidium sp. AG-Ba]QRW11709.1 hypothetical protein RhiLY_10708 [Ceratobasidium sp. AG-Ba]